MIREGFYSMDASYFDASLLVRKKHGRTYHWNYSAFKNNYPKTPSFRWYTIPSSVQRVIENAGKTQILLEKLVQEGC